MAVCSSGSRTYMVVVRFMLLKPQTGGGALLSCGVHHLCRTQTVRCGCLQANKGLREAFLINEPGQGWRAPQVGELCCKRPKLAKTLDRSKFSSRLTWLSAEVLQGCCSASWGSQAKQGCRKECRQRRQLQR